MIDETIRRLATSLGEHCRRYDCQVVTAESCTGGGVAEAITAIAGSSGWFETGYVTYSNAAKQRLLGVSEASLERWGAVSESVVREMVAGACQDSGARLGVAISGIAGPDGGSADKPVGTVWLAWAYGGRTTAECHVFPGNRDEVRRAAVIRSLEGLIESLETGA
ncbi:CinA family protein [Kushneria phosphatilytica]|uniref:Nicotinamide-nucleotide amidohydrolase family protein n=1 Tax=Kushneria phosphatilytica TaxID=657387 RepID=A0A1S1NYA4_9GAMM|nr:nicotinamide-nucleotide amidohydrolase family protein [Kushneria phosphatilytica]OHV13855.1 damage-inducible protein CinA [Kushneria phosphatilytica]QEL10409.1 nicotinamide-nucleotide amidohydrolase family protein [Kushneria phosphatilytica]